MTTSTHVVYNSRAGEAFDNALMDGTLLPIIIAGVAFFITFYNMGMFLEKRRWKYSRNMQNIAMFGVSGIAAYIAFKLSFWYFIL